MMRLSEDLEERFGIELTQFEEERRMPYVTSIERLAEARGEARGKATLMLAQLDELVGEMLGEQKERIRQLSSQQLDQLGRELVRFQSVADLQNWLDRHTVADQ